VTKLIVKPINPQAPGSYRERKEFLGVLRKFREAQKEENQLGVIDAYDALEAYIQPRLYSNDGTPIVELLDQLSANEFDELIRTIYQEPEVPPEIASS